jgi:hypothetical protein
MSGFWTAGVRCIKHVSTSWYGVLSLILTAIGALKDVGGFQNIPLPAWLWWLAAIAALFFLAVRLQYRLDAQEEGSIRRLRMKNYVTFREIAEALPQVYPAYSKEDIYLQLTKAVANAEFNEFSGHSRLHVTLVDSNGNVKPERPIEDGPSFLRKAAGLEPSDKISERAVFEAALGPPAYSDSIVGALTFEQRDFSRWYKRFQNGRYEN